MIDTCLTTPIRPPGTVPRDRAPTTRQDNPPLTFPQVQQRRLDDAHIAEEIRIERPPELLHIHVRNPLALADDAVVEDEPVKAPEDAERALDAAGAGGEVGEVADEDLDALGGGGFESD